MKNNKLLWNLFKTYRYFSEHYVWNMHQFHQSSFSVLKSCPCHHLDTQWFACCRIVTYVGRDFKFLESQEISVANFGYFTAKSRYFFEVKTIESRASKCMSLSSSFLLMVPQLWTQLRYSCLYLGYRIHEFLTNTYI